MSIEPEKIDRSEYLASLPKAFAVIKAFGASRQKLTLADVARAAGLPRATARRVLLTLQTLGYVSVDGRSFALQSRILELGYSYLSGQPWWRAAQSIAEALADELDVPIAAGIIEENHAVYLAHARPRRLGDFGRSIGTKIPLSISAIGRVLLAQLHDEDLETRLRSLDLVRLTSLTITDRNHLQRAILACRDLGYSLIDQELEIGSRSLAVPILDRSRKVIAAIGISSSGIYSDPQSLVATFLKPLRIASAKITADLAY